MAEGQCSCSSIVTDAQISLAQPKQNMRLMQPFRNAAALVEFEIFPNIVTQKH